MVLLKCRPSVFDFDPGAVALLVVTTGAGDGETLGIAQGASGSEARAIPGPLLGTKNVQLAARKRMYHLSSLSGDRCGDATPHTGSRL